MRRTIRITSIALLCCCTLASELASANMLQEGWYRMRSRENMKIGNYDAAIEAYEKYLELQPDDREALKGIALAYEKQGDTDKAIARYDKYLELYQDDADTAFRQANFLIWSRYAYRKKDAIKYFKMGLNVEDRPKERLKLAQLLAQDKYDLDGSVEQYEILLEQAPQNQQVRKEYRNILLWDDRYLTKAITQYEYFVERNPNDFNARLQLAELLGKSRRRKQDGVGIYAQLVQEKPNDNQLRRDYARLLTVTSGNFDEARKQYQVLVKRQPTTAMMTEAAAQLEQRKAYRREALNLYNHILKKEPNNRPIRLRRASIYMDDKSTAPKALADYQTVIKQEPSNADAHRGAAEALAWLERPDDALYHAKLARKYSQGDASTKRLHSKLTEGREPRVGALLELTRHNGDDNYKLQGMRLGASVSGDISPYITAGFEIGQEKYKGEDDNASGGWWQLKGEYRLSPKQKFNVAVENHSIRETGDSQTFAVSYSYTQKPPYWSYTLGYDSELVDDSYLALVGDATNNIGGATRHQLYTDFSKGDEDKRFSLHPALGWVDSESESTNEFIDLSGSMRFAFSKSPGLKSFYGAEMTLMSYADDHSGFAINNQEPLSGGYFSPEKFVSALVFADFVKPIAQSGELTAKIGPKVQLVDDASATNDVESGFYGSIAYTHKRDESLYLIIRAEHDKVGNLYRSSMLQGQAVYIF